MIRKTLDQIAIEHGTDKATEFTRTYAKPHGYTVHLEPFFEPLRDLPIKLLEIGAAGGESIKTWLEYFTHSKSRVVGVDNVQGTNRWNTVKAEGITPRYTFVFGDQSDPTFWKCFAVDYGAEWDVVIDDGGHYNDQILTSFEYLWPLLKSGGIYCVEDLGVAYGAGSIFVKPGYPNHIDWLRSKIDQLNTDSDIHSITFSKELAILKKK